MSRRNELAKKGEACILLLLADESLTPEQQFDCLSALSLVAARKRVLNEGSGITTASLPLLSRTLWSDVRKVRNRTMDVLKQIGGQGAAELFVSALQSEDRHIVFTAALRLDETADRVQMRAFLPELTRCLSGQSGNLAPKHRWAVVRCIDSARSPNAVEILARCALEPDWRVRRDASGALARVGTSEARLALEAAVKQLSFVRGRFARRCLLALKYGAT